MDMHGKKDVARLNPFREEANPNQKPFGRQEAHLAQIRNYVDFLAEQPYEPPKEQVWEKRSFGEYIHERPQNQTLLIDGPRGSGKTTLLVQLIKRWQDDEQKGSNIVPLRIVDLEIAPSGSSLLLQVAQALRFVSSEINEAEEGVESKAWNKWNRFVQIAATTGAGSIDTRRPNLDLESFTYELAESLPGFLDIRRTFHQFMDLLVREYQRYKQTTPPRGCPLFVVGIDDADMSPHRSAELLAVTRVLRHPRLVFILTGDIDLFRSALHAHHLSLLRASLQHRKFSDEDVKRLDDFTRAAQLGEDMLDKALPSQQRFRIDDVDPRFGLEFLRGDKLKSKRFTFGALDRGLNAPDCTARADTNPSLYQYLANDSLANRLLFRSIRILGDLRGAIDRVAEADQDPGAGANGIPRLLADLWDMGLNKSGIAAQDKVLLREAVRVETPPPSNRSETPPQDDPTDTGDVLVVDPGCVEWEQVRAYDRSVAYPDHTWLDCHLIRTTGLRARLVSQDPAIPGMLLSPVAAGVLMLATDVTADHKIWRIAQAPAMGSRAISLVEVGFHHAGLVLWLAWPTPDWPAFIDHAALVQRWDNYLDRFREEMQSATLLSLAFQMTYLVAKVAELRFSPIEDVRRVERQRMIKSVTELQDSHALPEKQVLDATRDNAIRRWLHSLWLLASPEYGLGAGERKKWAAALRAAGLATPRHQENHDLRLGAILRALRRTDRTQTIAKAEEIIKAIDKSDTTG
jgi:hypothetical protein